jgi:hypothetical protein
VQQVRPLVLSLAFSHFHFSTLLQGLDFQEQLLGLPVDELKEPRL